MGLGIEFSRHKRQSRSSAAVLGSTDASGNTSSQGSLSGAEEDGEGDGPAFYRAIYPFPGTTEDELQFEKGDVIQVTRVVDGGWWEGVLDGHCGWFPGNYVEKVTDVVGQQSAIGADGPDVYHNLVVKDILDTEQAYVHDLHSVYLDPLKSTSILRGTEQELLSGNLAELIRWQQAFLASLQNASKLPIPQQNFGAIFCKAAKEVELLYSTYCANHPKAVAVLTDNSDKLSSFMESRGAASPGILALTSNLSKPFRRLEKYPALLKELHRQLTEGHADIENVSNAITIYTGISTRTQELRKRKELEHEMLTNQVQGYSGASLSELGECKCVLHANVAVTAEEVDERFLLVFPDDFVILAVGMSLSGYEMKARFPLSAVSVKKGSHTEQWPWGVEVLYHQETIHISLTSLRDLNTLIDCIGRQEGVPAKASVQRSASSVSQRGLGNSSFMRAYNTRAQRQPSVSIQRQHNWGFRSLRPMAPLNAPHLIALKDTNKSPKAGKKFIYPAVKRRRSSKAIEELQVPGVLVRPNPAETRVGDTAILNVIEAYCNTARFKAFIPGERPQMPLPGVQPVGVTNSPTLLTSPTHHHRLGERSSTLPQSSRYGNQAPPTSPPGGDRFSGKKQVLAPLRSRASYTHEFAVSTTPQVHFQLDTQRKRSESLNTHGKLF
jgi:hypothetical protein